MNVSELYLRPFETSHTWYTLSLGRGGRLTTSKKPSAPLLETIIMPRALDDRSVPLSRFTVEPGDADISARVDFSTIARVAEESGLRAHGPINQGDFLIALGIEARAEILSRNATETQRAGIGQALERLVGVGAMGCLFKVLALAERDAPMPAGFND